MSILATTGPRWVHDCSGPIAVQPGQPRYRTSGHRPVARPVRRLGQAARSGDFPAQNNGLFYRNGKVGLRDITDGTSSTMMFGERSSNVVDASWVDVPNYKGAGAHDFWSTMNPRVFSFLSTRAGGEVISADQFWAWLACDKTNGLEG